MKTLDRKDFVEVQGGVTEFTYTLLYILGRMAASPSKMAANGAASHEIIGFK